MNKRDKEGYFWESVAICIPCFLYALLIWIGFMDSRVNLVYLNQFHGTVIDRGTTIGDHSLTVFYIRIQGLDQTLGIYRMGGNYADLIDKIQVNDSIKVYYKGKKKSGVNIDLVRVDKEGELLIGPSEYENKQSSLIYIGAVLVLAHISAAIVYYRWKTRRIDGASR